MTTTSSAIAARTCSIFVELGASALLSGAPEASSLGSTITMLESPKRLPGVRRALHHIADAGEHGDAVIAVSARASERDAEEREVTRARLARAFLFRAANVGRGRLTFLISQTCTRQLRHELQGLVTTLIGEFGCVDVGVRFV